MSLAFGPHEDVVYDDAPLRSVLAQVTFDPILALISAAGATGFQTAIRHLYPNAPDAEQRTGISVGEGKIGIQQSAPLWRFSTPGEDWTVGLSAVSISLETPSYSNFGEFLERFAFLLSVLHKTLRPSDSRRIGLRKINVISLPDPSQPSSLAQRVRSELLGPLAWREFPAAIFGGGGQIHFKEDLNMLSVRYGIEGDSATTADFILDLDYYTDTPPTFWLSRTGSAGGCSVGLGMTWLRLPVAKAL